MSACAVMQPTYLPWSGWFNLMATADVFVFLDDAQFQRSSWHCRNQIVLGGAAHFLTVPVLRSGLETRIRDAEIDYGRDWRKSHEGQVRQAYGRAPWGRLVIERLTAAWAARPARLLELNLSVITGLAELLDIRTPTRLASELDVVGERSERLLTICERLGAAHYLSPAGSAGYLEADGFASSGRVALHLQHFVPEPYRQRGVPDFVPYMSVVDVIAHLGPEAASVYVRRPSFPSYTEESP